MLAYGNVLFSIYCEDFYYRKGLVDIIDKLYLSEAPLKKLRKLNSGVGSQFFQADIVVLSSKSIFEKMPNRENLEKRNGSLSVVFSSKNMFNIISGINGYENSLFLPYDIEMGKVREVFYELIFGSDASRRMLFEKKNLVNLTSKEKKISQLFNDGLNQQQIAKSLGLNAKTVSSHLRNAMMKYQVGSLIEYRVKLKYMKSANLI